MLTPKTRKKEVETEADKRRKEKERLLASLLLLLIKELDFELGFIALTYANGGIKFFKAMSFARETLISAHRSAWNVGAMSNASLLHSPSSVLPSGEFDTSAVNLWRIADEQLLHWGGFLRDIGDGRYYQKIDAAIGFDTRGNFFNGEEEVLRIKEEAIESRAELYANALYSTAVRAWASSFPLGTKFYWRLDSNENHCRDCPEWAKGSPYVLHTLPAFPGDGKSQCVTNCRCWLETENGQRSLEIR